MNVYCTWRMSNHAEPVPAKPSDFTVAVISPVPSVSATRVRRSSAVLIAGALFLENMSRWHRRLLRPAFRQEGAVARTIDLGEDRPDLLDAPVHTTILRTSPGQTRLPPSIGSALQLRRYSWVPHTLLRRKISKMSLFLQYLKSCIASPP